MEIVNVFSFDEIPNQNKSLKFNFGVSPRSVDYYLKKKN